MLASGLLLFTSEAVKLYYHEAFWVKMTSLLLSMVFTVHGAAKDALADPDRVTAIAAAAQSAVISLLLWFAGRSGRTVDRLFLTLTCVTSPRRPCARRPECRSARSCLRGRRIRRWGPWSPRTDTRSSTAW